MGQKWQPLFRPFKQMVICDVLGQLAEQNPLQCASMLQCTRRKWTHHLCRNPHSSILCVRRNAKCKNILPEPASLDFWSLLKSTHIQNWKMLLPLLFQSNPKMGEGQRSQQEHSKASDRLSSHRHEQLNKTVLDKHCHPNTTYPGFCQVYTLITPQRVVRVCACVHTCVYAYVYV